MRARCTSSATKELWPHCRKMDALQRNAPCSDRSAHAFHAPSKTSASGVCVFRARADCRLNRELLVRIAEKGGRGWVGARRYPRAADLPSAIGVTQTPVCVVVLRSNPFLTAANGIPEKAGAGNLRRHASHGGTARSRTLMPEASRVLLPENGGPAGRCTLLCRLRGGCFAV